jgi:predicted MFS family arabinose efflux permease
LATLPAIAASRILVGIAEAGVVTGSTILLATYFGGDDRQKWFAYQNIALPLLVIVLLQVTGHMGDLEWRRAFIAYGFAFAMLALTLLLLPRGEDGERGNDRANAARAGGFFPPARVVALVVAIAVPGSIMFYVAPVEIGFLLQAHGYAAPSQMATAISIAIVSGVLGPLLSRRITHWRVGVVLAIAMSLMGLGLIVMATGSNFAAITAGMALQQAGGGIMLTTGLTYIVSLAAPAQSGRYAGNFMFFYMLAQFAAPLLMVALRHALGSRSSAIIAAGIASITACVWLLPWRALRREVVPSVSP